MNFRTTIALVLVLSTAHILRTRAEDNITIVGQTSVFSSNHIQMNADGTLKSATEVGSSLVIDEWKCTIRKDFDKPGIRCDNTSDYCAKLFDRVKEFNKHIFGCIDPKSPNHPCNNDEVDPMEVDTIDEVPVSGRQMAQYNHSRCGPHGVGSYRIGTD